MKSIKIKEEKLRLFVSQMLNEANGPTFGVGSNYVDYTEQLKALDKIENLHIDRYKDYVLEEAWNNWKKVGCDKNSDEYKIYISAFKHFMMGSGGFLGNISYVLDNYKKADLHIKILSKKWIDAINGVKGMKDWKYSDLNSSEGSEGWQCFYTTILKIYQNPAIWNDLFFNPLFKQYKDKLDTIVTKIRDLIKKEYNKYKTFYQPILPKEFSKLLNFVDGIKYAEGKIERVNNCHPELFYNGEVFDRSEPIPIEDEEYD